MRFSSAPIFVALAVAAMAAQLATALVFHLGTPVRDFPLQDLDGRMVRYSTLKGNVTVVAFISSRCPMSNAFNFRMNELYNEFAGRVRLIAVNANANESLDEVRHHAQNMGYDFPVYKDVDNVAADLFGAQITPETFVMDQQDVVQYHGSIEDSPNPERAKHHALRVAIEAVLDGRPVPTRETHSLGCAIRRIRPRGN
jgi:peroxiredoxin